MTRLAAALAALLSLACAAPIHSESYVQGQTVLIRKVALIPLEEDLMRGGPGGSEAAAIVTARVLDALGSETKLRVVGPAQADAVLSGVVRRWVERDGSASGVRQAASVWFVLELRDGEGRKIWSGTYEETQAPLSEDAGSFPRAWDRGFRWVTAEELANYGARELVHELAVEVASWS